LYLSFFVLDSNFKKEFKQILPFLFVKISTHRDLKHPKNFLNSFNRRKDDDNLIRNGEKTLQETTFLQPNNDNVMISIETDMNNVDTGNHKNENENGNITHNGNSQKRKSDNNLMNIKGCDEIATSFGEQSGSDRTTSSRTADTSIS
jgi:hypothetical protein